MLELFKHHRKLSKKYVPKPPYFLDFFQICCRKSNFSFCDVPKAGFSARRPPRRFDLSAESVKSPTFASFAGTKKTMIVITIAFVTYEIQADSLRHLPFFRLPDPFFISDSGVCRSSDFYIQMQSFQLHQRTHFAFSPGHDSPSNDRLSPYADYPAQKRYFVITATKEACIFASMHLAAAPTCPGISPDSLVQQGTRMRVRSLIASSGRAFATKAF